MSKLSIKENTIHISHIGIDGFTCSLLLDSRPSKSKNIYCDEIDFSLGSDLRRSIENYTYVIITDLPLTQDNIYELNEIHNIKGVDFITAYEPSSDLMMLSSKMKTYYEENKSSPDLLADLMGIENPYKDMIWSSYLKK